ncbi:MAG TPA: PilZ domain-containing protein [Nitrospiria bacterium]|nr:PilZ domain-containing protein [Nitrospiria bacterium]
MKVNQEDESLSIENPDGKEIARLVLDDFLSRLGATARGFKRQFPRLGMGVCVKYADREGNSCEGIASTIGGGGLFIEALKPLPEGIDTSLEFMLPASQKVITAKARVVWVRKNFVQKFFYPGMGMQFVEISDGDRAELVDFVDKFNMRRGTQEC